MKIRQFLATLLLLAGAVALGGCSDEYDPYYHSVPGGGYAYRANDVHFYYVNPEGNSLIDKTLPSSGTWTSCQIAVDEAGMPFFKCYFPIDQSTDTYTFYVYSNGSFDRFDLSYGYTNDGVGGDGWVTHVLSLKINGQHVYSDEEASSQNTYCSVYVQKSDAGTRVWSKY